MLLVTGYSSFNAVKTTATLIELKIDRDIYGWILARQEL